MSDDEWMNDDEGEKFIGTDEPYRNMKVCIRADNNPKQSVEVLCDMVPSLDGEDNPHDVLV